MGSQETGQPSVSIVVPVGGSGSGFDRCLAGLARLEPLPAEITIVVDGPSARLEEQASSFATMLNLRSGQTGQRVRVVVQERNRGPAAARNLGAASSTGDLLVFVDADVEVEADLVARVAGIFRVRTELAAAIGSYDSRPAAPTLVSQYRNLLHHWVHQQASSEASTFWGACGAIRRSVFESLGGFDESIRLPSIEDIELGARLRAAGHQIAMVKDLQVKHLKRWTPGEVIRTDLWRRAVPWTRLMLAREGLINDLNVKPRERVSVAVMGLLGLLVLLGIWWTPAWWLTLGLAVVLIVLNAAFYGFLTRERGLLFLLGALPWHWIYLLVCGLGYAIGWTSHQLGRGRGW